MIDIETDITDDELTALLEMKPLLGDFMRAVSAIARQASTRDEAVRLTAAMYLRAGRSLVELAEKVARIGVANT